MARTHVQLLGGVGASRDDTQLDVGPPKCRLVLAALALSLGEAVSVPRLVDLVWGEEPPATAPKILQGYVSRLRKALGAASIERVGAAYRLEPDAVDVDVSRFQERAVAGDARSARTEWTGVPLAGLDAPGLQPAVDGLVEQWLGVVEQDLAARAEDDPESVIGPLTELTSAHPFRERMWALLMTALHRTGRQADALEAYRRARRQLVDELGVEPGRELREAEARILASDEEPTGRPQQVAPQRHSGNLPVRTVSLVGRETELQQVSADLGGDPLVTLVGPGGVGKTTLAVAAAHRWQEAAPGRVVWFVALDDVRADEAVDHAVAEALGVVEAGGVGLGETIAGALGSRSALLVLDNCEHVVTGASRLVHALVQAGARVLTTSREPLGVRGEQVVQVEPLDPSGPAVQLFIQRAQAAAPDVDLAADRRTIEEICVALDGLPLAIELAASRTRALSPAQLRDRLGSHLQLLTGPRAAMSRHQTLDAAVQWSHDLLSSDEQRVFARLSVFSGWFDLDAAEAVASDAELDPLAVDQLLGDLVDRSMVTVDATGGRRRFRLLETLRQFAARELEATGERDRVEQRHTTWCTAQVATIGDGLAGHDEVAAVAALDELWPNLRSAFERAVTATDEVAATALLRPVVTEVNLRRRAEVGVWAEQVLELAADEDDVLFWLTWALHRHMQAGNADALDRLIERHGHGDHPLVRYSHAYLHESSATLCDASPLAAAWLRDRGHELAAELVELSGVGPGLMTTGQLGELRERAAGWVDRHRTHGPATMLYFSLGLLGYAAQLQGDLDAARAHFLDAAGVAVPAGTYRVTRPVEARAVFDSGDRSRGLAMLREHVDDVLDAGTVDVARLAAVEFVPIMVELGRLHDAARALAHLDTTGDFGRLARHSLVVEAVQEIEAEPDLRRVVGQPVDAVDALTHMREVLAQLE